MRSGLSEMNDTRTPAGAPMAPAALLKDAAVSDSVPSSSPAFGTPVRPVRVGKPNTLSAKASILPILLPPATLRPIAFRTFTRKHNLTITSTALQSLATFVGKNCGSGWREEGLAERVLDEAAKMWKKAGGGVIVEDGNGASLKAILQTLEGSMSGGRIIAGKATGQDSHMARVNDLPGSGTSANTVHPTFSTVIEGDGEDKDHSNASLDPRKWIKVVGAFDQPQLTYNVNKKHFEPSTSKPSLFPSPSHKAAFFRDRYNLVYQRLLRNESFQTSGPSFQHSSTLTAGKSFKLTPIVNLLGRSGTSHMLLGLLSVSPAGELSLTDLTGSIRLDLSHARTVPEDGAWFAPGMIVLVDGIYEEEESIRGSALGGNSGVGGAIGGRFVGISICGPPCERREITLGTSSSKESGDLASSGCFAGVDFLGVGSERAQGLRMRRIRAGCLRYGQNDNEDSSRRTMAIMSEVNLDNVKTLEALKKVLSIYCDLPLSELPLVFVMIGSFVRDSVISGGGRGGSIEYKEYFDSLALVLSEFPSVLRHSTFVFVPGDNDPWASAFSAGATTAIPREAIPELFTSRVKRAFLTANNESEKSYSAEVPGEAVWTSNPSRICMFGPVHEIVVFRDDMSGRLRRSAVLSGTETIKPDIEMSDEPSSRSVSTSSSQGGKSQVPPVEGNRRMGDDPSAAMLAARKLVKTILDQGNMSPFPLTTRPVLWDYASSLQLYPLPTAFVLADAETAPFTITYEGCHVMNPGRLVPEGNKKLARWIEYDILKNRGKVREERY